MGNTKMHVLTTIRVSIVVVILYAAIGDKMDAYQIKEHGQVNITYLSCFKKYFNDLREALSDARR